MSYEINIVGNDPLPLTGNAEDTLLTSLSSAAQKLITVGCRKGGCGVCKVRVVSGDVELIQKMSAAYIGPADQTEGYYLACSIKPKSNLLVELL